MNQAETMDQQRNVIERMREHSRRWHDYDKTAPMAEFEQFDCTVKKYRKNMLPWSNWEPVEDDPSPHVEVVRLVPWFLGGALAVVLFVGFGVYAFNTWQPVEKVLTFVQPIKNTRWVK